ncbi:MAG TPA: dihydrolipoyl dehydrogenase [Bacillota bacterium]|nr:dihydrolipoyl dehydrogenase [Bacillota bacterium]
MKQYDIAVIGGGPAGYIAAIKGAQLGASVVLFEKSVLGGTCLNRGCIPTKTYLKGAEMIHHIRTAAKYGILNDTFFSVDMNKAVANKNSVVKQLTQGVGGLLKSNGVEVVYGDAALASETSVACGGQEYHARSIILCGGSKTNRIPIPGIEDENVLTSDKILDLTELPRRLAIIGGGVIGCEIATAFHYYGCEVTIIEAEERILPQMDTEISKSLAEVFKKEGIQVLAAHAVEKIQHAGGESTVFCKGGKTVTADKILLSIGRTADVSCLGALKERVGMKNGKVVVDDAMRTNIPNIYAPGDINGKNMLAHAAFKMGETAAKNAMGGNAICKLDHVPGCIYTMPECASVGLTEEAAKEKYGKDRISVGKFPFAANGRALASNESRGFVKVIVESRYKELLGVHIFGGLATEMISEAVSLISSEIPADEIAEMVHAHPSYSEAFMEACADALGECMHLPRKKG